MTEKMTEKEIVKFVESYDTLDDLVVAAREKFHQISENDIEIGEKISLLSTLDQLVCERIASQVKIEIGEKINLKANSKKMLLDSLLGTKIMVQAAITEAQQLKEMLANTAIEEAVGEFIEDLYILHFQAMKNIIILIDSQK